MSSLQAGLVAAVLLVWPLMAAAEPPCAKQCAEMAKRGELKEGVNQEGCVLRVCQEEGRRLYRSNEHEAAREALDFLYEDLGMSPSYQLDLGLVHYALGRFDDALTSFDFVLGRFPESMRAGTQRAYTLLRLRRFAEAEAQFEKLLELPGVEGEFRGLRTRSFVTGNIGAVQLMLGKADAGRKSLKEALKIDGRNGLASTYLFRVLPALDRGELQTEGLFLLLVASEDVGLRRYDNAEKSLSKLISTSPKFGEAYALQSELLLATHRYEECETKLRKAEGYLPDDVDLKARRIRCSLLANGPTSNASRAALAEAEALRASHPDNQLLREILQALDRS